MFTGYQIGLRLASPLHLGHRLTGNLKSTRRYVPGRAIWGALASRIARDEFGGRYPEAGQRVHDDMRFTCLFVAGEDLQPSCFPWGDSAAEFEWRHLQSYTSTALSDGHSKEDGSLHETEYLAPTTREGRPVWLAGALWIRGPNQKDLSRLLDRLQFGGERGYGWGRVADVKLRPFSSQELVFGGWRWSANERTVTLSAPHPTWLPAPLNATQHHPDWIGAGVVEPVVGRVTDGSRDLLNPRFGALLSLARVCWAPGSPVVKSTPELEIGEFGVLVAPPDEQP